MFIAFDLDGTLADPSDGVTNGINHTLKILNRPERLRGDLLKYIGPPTEWIFSDVLQTSDNQLIERARSIFTEFYRTHGYRQNVLYQHSHHLVNQLKRIGHHLVVVTSKSDSGAKAAAAHFRLQDLFQGVFGRQNDCSKTDSLNLALTTSESRPAIMIGDRKYDITAGKACNCITVGVTYGFGTREELEIEKPDFIASSQMELLDIIQSI